MITKCVHCKTCGAVIATMVVLGVFVLAAIFSPQVSETDRYTMIALVSCSIRNDAGGGLYA